MIHEKIKIIPENEEDIKIASQLTDLINWKIVESKSDKHPECGYPLGKILCRTIEEAEAFIQKSEFNDLYIKDYKENA
jgi:hypothetical protein